MRIAKIRAISSFALIIIVVVIIAIAGAGAYFILANQQTTSNVVSCQVDYYSVWSLAVVSNSSTRYTSTTLSGNSSYTTTTSVRQSVGYEVATTETYTGTLTGALAKWNVQYCTYVTK